jgi:uracil phosphoribosyltransferase
VLLLDPMLATGGSAIAALHAIRESYVGPLTVISLVAAPIGVAAVLAADSTCEIVTAALDDRLDDNGYIRPGLGDAGDRSFGTFG